MIYETLYNALRAKGISGRKVGRFAEWRYNRLHDRYCKSIEELEKQQDEKLKSLEGPKITLDYCMNCDKWAGNEGGCRIPNEPPPYRQSKEDFVYSNCELWKDYDAQSSKSKENMEKLETEWETQIERYVSHIAGRMGEWNISQLAQTITAVVTTAGMVLIALLK